MDLVVALKLAGGLGLLVGGAELLVRGASRIALRLGLSPLVIGLTVVAFGTSTPELAVTLRAAFAGTTDVALGNVVGSNIFNVLFILGASAVVTPLVVSQQLVRLDVPIVVGVSILTLVLTLDGRLAALDGAILFACFVAYTVFVIRQSRSESAEVESEYAREYGNAAGADRLSLSLLAVVLGLALLVGGATALVDAAVAIARIAGLGETVIGLTIVAAGTSLPELATSMLAAFRGERDIAVGNVIGSNVFNVLAIAGLAALIPSGGLPVAPALVRFDIPVMLAVSFACLPIFFTGHRISRGEGFLFLAYYVAYATYLVLDATGHEALPAYSAVLLKFALPLTVVTLTILLVRALREPRA